jgi:transcriptional regulator with XRE-family HTH domain
MMTIDEFTKEHEGLLRKFIGARIQSILERREYLEEKRIAWKELAFRSGLSRGYYWRLAHGQENPTLITLVKMAIGLEMDLSELVEDVMAQVLDRNWRPPS